jgi:Zn-dependent metalloprotease
MVTVVRRTASVLAMILAVVTLQPHAQNPPAATRVAATAGSDLARWNARVQQMITAGDLQETRRQVDTQIPGREHVRMAQMVNRVPVFGAEVVLQRDARDIYSINGLVYENLDIETTPKITGSRALAIAAADLGVEHRPEADPALTILPLDEGGFALTYMFHVRTQGDRLRYFVDAMTGGVRLKYSDLWRQTPAVGRATGTWNDLKKMSAAQLGGTFFASDELRPPTILTLNMQGRGYLNYFLQIPPRDSDVANDADNDWTDGAVVDAHVYAGYTYDWYFKRFGRRGINNADLPIISLVHNISRTNPDFRDPDVSGLFGNNAFWDGQWMWYGEGDGVTETFNSAGLDIVAHELTHGVTQYTSQLVYRNESGALNESISDIFGVSVEFFFEPIGSGRNRAEWLLGEDATVDFARMLADPNYDRPVRSLADPRTRFQPDHYSIRFLGTADNGGVHINSGISNNAFYLFVQGGTNRTSGMTVQGIGLDNRDRAERIFYRAFAFLVGPSTNFAAARRLTLQAAAELYGASSVEATRLAQAWTAVGVN